MPITKSIVVGAGELTVTSIVATKEPFTVHVTVAFPLAIAVIVLVDTVFSVPGTKLLFETIAIGGAEEIQLIWLAGAGLP